jgi:hypothetical protein
VPRLAKENGSSDVLDALRTMVVTQKDLYDKRLRSRLNRILKDEQLIHKDDKAEIIEHWYRCHRLIEIYHLFRSTSLAPSRSDNAHKHEDNWFILKELIDSMPICTPLQIPSKTGSARDMDEYLKRNLDRVEEFHEALQSRYHYVTESCIGKHQLKDTIAILRACCQMENGTNESWIKALKAYRSLYTCLVTRARSSNDCLFVSKK